MPASPPMAGERVMMPGCGRACSRGAARRPAPGRTHQARSAPPYKPAHSWLRLGVRLAASCSWAAEEGGALDANRFCRTPWRGSKGRNLRDAVIKRGAEHRGFRALFGAAEGRLSNEPHDTRQVEGDPIVVLACVAHVCGASGAIAPHRSMLTHFLSTSDGIHATPRDHAPRYIVHAHAWRMR